MLKNLLDDEVEECNITCESCEQFKKRVLRTLDRIDIEVIDKTMESISKCIYAIVAGKGC